MLSFLNRLIARIGAVFRSSDFDRELDAELSAHLKLRAEDLIREGMQPDEAEHLARIQLIAGDGLPVPFQTRHDLSAATNFCFDRRLNRFHRKRRLLLRP